jgi:predicted MPP superfamily phosphohydrolase
MDRLGFIGDVHGSDEALTSLLVEAQRLCDRLIFLGDYVDRGRNSAAVLEVLLQLQKDKPDVVFLEGNHDIAFRECLEVGGLDEFLLMGGAATIRSYVPELSNDILADLHRYVPASHRKFMSQLKSHFEDDQLVAVHSIEQLAKGSIEVASRFLIEGHIPQPSLAPMIELTGAAIDTGCGTIPNGKLTCFLWPSQTYVQSVN